MSHVQGTRRFKANPVEVAIFSIITLIFFNSLYNLLYSRGGFVPAALVPMTANPLSEGRKLASIPHSLGSWDIPCNERSEKDTPSSKIRLNGALCGADFSSGASKLIKASITNTTNQYNATVFTDVYEGKFSTEYIPLNEGKNVLHVEFSFFGGTAFRQDYVINKN
jgi:hypothetical protein